MTRRAMTRGERGGDDGGDDGGVGNVSERPLSRVLGRVRSLDLPADWLCTICSISPARPPRRAWGSADPRTPRHISSDTWVAW